MDTREKTNIMKISDDEFENVSGGLLFNSSGIDGADKDNPWEVIDGNTGETLARFKTQDEAKDEARRRKMSYKEIYWKDLCDLRDMR